MWPSEYEEGEEEEGDDHDAHGDEGVGGALGGEAHEQEHREAKGKGRDGLQDKVVGGRGLEARVDLAEENHAVGGSASKHAEH